MKKSFIYILLLIYFLCLVNAEPVFISNQDQFQPGETLIGKIIVESGNFEGSISRNQIKFYEGRRETLFDYELRAYNNSYYFFVYLNKQGNFTLKVSDILYKDAEGVLRSYILEKELEIISRPEIKENSSFIKILSIRPGLVFTSGIPEIVLENKGNTPFNITYGLDKITKNSEKKTLHPNRPEKIIFEVNNSFSNFLISSYSEFEVPIIYTGQLIPQIDNETHLKTDKYLVQIKTLVNTEFTDSISLFNLEMNNISKIKIVKSLDLINIHDFDNTINAGESQKINFSILSENQGYFKDNLTISFDEGKLKGEIIVPIEIYVFSENTSLETINISSSGSAITLSCADKGAQKCEGYCNGRDDYASDGYCCYGECTATDYSSSESGTDFGWLWGLIIFIVIGAGAYLIYKKVKSVKPKSSSEQITEKTKSFENRVSGNLART